MNPMACFDQLMDIYISPVRQQNNEVEGLESQMSFLLPSSTPSFLPSQILAHTRLLTFHVCYERPQISSRHLMSMQHSFLLCNVMFCRECGKPYVCQPHMHTCHYGASDMAMSTEYTHTHLT